MDQNPFGGPPPFGQGAQFPQAFTNAGVPFFAPPPAPHLLLQQQQFAAVGQQQPPRQAGYGYQQQQQQPVGGGPFLANFSQAGPSNHQQHQPYETGDNSGRGHSRGQDNFRRPENFRGRGGGRGGGHGGHGERQNSFNRGQNQWGGDQQQRGGRGGFNDRPSSSSTRGYGEGNRGGSERQKFNPSPSPSSGNDLNEFGDMGAAARSYQANVPKYQSMRSETGDSNDGLPKVSRWSLLIHCKACIA